MVFNLVFYQTVPLFIPQILVDFVLQFGEEYSNTLSEYWPLLQDQVKNLNIKYPRIHTQAPHMMSDFIIVIENLREYNEKTFALTVNSLVKVGDVSSSDVLLTIIYYEIIFIRYP